MTKLKEGLIKVSIPVVTKEDWERFIDVWVPLFSTKGITHRTLLSKLPDDIDIEKEVKELEAEKVRQLLSEF